MIRLWILLCSYQSLNKRKIFSGIGCVYEMSRKSRKDVDEVTGNGNYISANIYRTLSRFPLKFMTLWLSKLKI